VVWSRCRGRPARCRKLSTGRKFSLDSGAALAANHLETRFLNSAVAWRCQGRVADGRAESTGAARFACVRFSGSMYCNCVFGARPAGVTDRPSPSIVGVPHWLIFWFSARARGLRFQPVSRPSGFCSRAFRVSPCRCAVRLAAKCTSGSPMTPGSAPPGNPAMRACSTHPAHRCTPQKRRNRISASSRSPNCSRRGVSRR
jgi:hypothetical protein